MTRACATPVVIVLSCALLAACSSTPSSQPEGAGALAKIPISTKSADALAHYLKGEALFENARADEGVVELDQALQLDPDFVTAKALHGYATPGPDGLRELEAVASAAGKLPEAERRLVDGMAAQRRGELEQAVRAYTSVTELASGNRSTTRHNRR
jgi:hypothetical protein